MVAAACTTMFNMAWSSLPRFPNATERGQFLTRLFHDSLMFVAANAALHYKGHPVFLITGYFTGIVLDRAVQEYFEKVKQVAFFTLFAKLCLVSAAWSYVVDGAAWSYWPYMMHAATFVLGAKIGSVLSLRYCTPLREEAPSPPWNDRLIDGLMFVGAETLFFLKGHKLILLSGLVTGIFGDEKAKQTFEKVKWIAYCTLPAQLWFTGATWPHMVQATTFIVGTKIGSVLSLRFQRLQGGRV